MAEIDFTGRVAIVTGASRGIGRTLALGLARRGASVVGTARSLSSSPGSGGTLQSMVEAAAERGGTAIAVPADITGEAGAQAVVTRAMSEFGRVDILINSAGAFPLGTIAELPPEEWRALMSINLTAPFLMARAVLPTMMEQGSGNIMNVTSGAAGSYSPGRIANAASKAALNRFSMNLAEEVREHGVAVNAWGPGLVRTDMTDYAANGVEPEVIVDSVMWLVSQDAESFTGQVVRRVEFGETWGLR